MLLLCADTPHGNLFFFLFFFSYTYTHIQLSTLASNFSGILFFFAERVRSESEEKGRFPKNSVAVLARVDSWMFLRVGEKEKKKKLHSNLINRLRFIQKFVDSEL